MRTLFVTSNRLGDAVLSTAVLARLLEQHPQSRVTVACGPVATALFQDIPQVERVIPWRKARLGAHWPVLWSSVVGVRWDLVVDLRGSALSWMLAAGERRVYRTPADHAHRLTQMARALDLEAPLAPCLWVSDEARRRAAEVLGDDPRPILALAPTANWPPKAWAGDRFVELIDRLTGEGAALAGARVLVAAGPGERQMAAPVLGAVPVDRRIDLIDRVPLMVLGAAFARCRVVVANDSGLMHLAAAAGVPTLGLFGPSDERHYAPSGAVTAWVRSSAGAMDLLARSGEVGRDPGALMDGLSVEAVEAAALNLLKG